jgi:hypothetical protein
MQQQMPSARLRERAAVGKRHQGGGREVIDLDWTLSHHEEGIEIKRTEMVVNVVRQMRHTLVKDMSISKILP